MAERALPMQRRVLVVAMAASLVARAHPAWCDAMTPSARAAMQGPQARRHQSDTERREARTDLHDERIVSR